ncbi:MAG: pentapeptide repeat-containing protein [Crocinitomicaceae bacterium]|jgi:fluoroquinolone resistance protein|nr:pentapeptide repeat-containing protein [Crocinitomicaceae bacterium]
MDYITDQTFEGLTFENLTTAEYENCVFQSCQLNGADLSNFTFVDCEFISSDLSSIRSKKTSFRDAYFRDCKLMGIHFEDCNPYGLRCTFESCTLDYSFFYQCPLKGTKFSNCRLTEVDFTEAGLEGVSFEGCQLTGSVFQMSNLEKANFTGAQGFIIDPSNNRMKGAKFSQEGLAGLLIPFGIEIS